MKKAGIKPILLSVTLILLQVALVACSANGTTVQNISSSQLARLSGSQHHGKQSPTTIHIGLNLPLSGVDASLGISAEDGALLALSQAHIPGYTFQLDAKNDASASGTPDATIAANNFKAFSQDARIAGVIGAFDTSTAEAELPLANNARLPLISLSATNPCLTGVSTTCGTLLNTLRPTGKTTFFRLAATDAQQGEALANFAYQSRFFRRISIIDDTSVSGMTQASGFSSQFQADGGVIVDRQSIGPVASYINLLTRIAALKVDAIFYAGSDAEAITIRRQQYQIPGLQNVSFIGGSGIHTSLFLQTINSAIGAPTYSGSSALSTTTGTFVQQYQAKYGPLGTYSAAGYDGATIIIAAIKAAVARRVKPATASNQVQSGKNFHLAVLQALAQTSLESITGKVMYTFAASGDLTRNVVQVDQNSANQWTQIALESIM